MYELIKKIVIFFEPGAMNEYGEFEGFAGQLLSFIQSIFA